MTPFTIAVASHNIKDLDALLATTRQVQTSGVTGLSGGIEQLLKLPTQPVPSLVILECANDSLAALAPLERLVGALLGWVAR